MVEKFSDYEGQGFLSREGEFEFEITDAELKQSKAGNDMWQFSCKCEEGMTTVYHSLNRKARWTFNKLIKACFKGNPPEELDYNTFGQQLVGKKFFADVICDSYEKQVKRPRDDGTFIDDVEVKESYKIDTMSYHW